MLTEADYLALTREHEALQGIVLRSERLSDEALDQVVERLLAIEQQLAESPPKTIRGLHALLLVLQRCATCDALEKTVEALLKTAVTATRALAAQLNPGRTAGPTHGKPSPGRL
jgi:hypothetical protein